MVSVETGDFTMIPQPQVYLVHRSRFPLLPEKKDHKEDHKTSLITDHVNHKEQITN
jgi:hypothetical protein